MNYWRCPGCGRTLTDKGFWRHQNEICRCGWPIVDFAKVRRPEAEHITQARETLERMEGKP